MFHLSIRAICSLSSFLLAMHAFSQDMSNWTDKTVCRLVESDTGPYSWKRPLVVTLLVEHQLKLQSNLGHLLV